MDFSRYITTIVAKINLYIVPQYLWLIITYYLMINITYKYFLFLFHDEQDIINSIPRSAIQLNSLILAEIDKWLPLVWFLGISLFFCGMFIGLIEHLPFFKNKKVAFDGKYGLAVGPWLCLIALTINMFHFIGGFFPIFLLIIVLFKQGIEEYFDKKRKN